jgi:hypothetical protein
MKINSNTIKLEEETRKAIEDAISKIASENNIDSVKFANVFLTPNNGIIKFAFAEEDDLYDAILDYNIDAVIHLIEEEHVDIHRDNDEALNLAAGIGNLDIVKYLVERGADINADHTKALRSAIMHQNGEVRDYLIAQGADVNNLEPYGSEIEE